MHVFEKRTRSHAPTPPLLPRPPLCAGARVLPWLLGQEDEGFNHDACSYGDGAEAKQSSGRVVVSQMLDHSCATAA